MQTDIRSQYQETLDMSRHGQPEVICVAQTGNQGHPHISIDPVFLMPRERLWESHIFSMSTGIPCAMPYWNMVLLSTRKHPLTSPDSDNDSGDFLDPEGPLPSNLPTEVQNIGAPSEQSTISFMGPLSGMTDRDLMI